MQLTDYEELIKKSIVVLTQTADTVTQNREVSDKWFVTASNLSASCALLTAYLKEKNLITDFLVWAKIDE